MIPTVPLVSGTFYLKYCCLTQVIDVFVVLFRRERIYGACFFGRPRGRSVVSRPCSLDVAVVHIGLPSGLPRSMLQRIAGRSGKLAFTRSI